MEWKFDIITPQTTKVDPAHLEFFRSEAFEDPVSALVREDIQNRLDAKSSKALLPVRVRYYLSGESHSIARWNAPKWLKGLDEHLNARKCLTEMGSKAINLDRPMPYLAIEDFNTTGLQGDPRVTSDPEDGTPRNDFYWFIRNVGRTGKKAGDRGRWGLGKIVYPASSMIRSFFCYSVREGDLQPTLIGRSVLAIHAISGSEYQSEGYWARFPDLAYPYFAVPEENENLISDFVNAFNIRRKPDEPGLSLVIPFPEDSITLNSLVTAIIQHYFWEILRGTLEVEVASDEKTTAVSRDTINDVVSAWPGLDESARRVTQHRLEFCRKADRMKLTDSTGYFELSKPKNYSGVRLPDLFKSSEHFESAKRRFRAGEIVVAEFVVAVRKKDAPTDQDASFLVYLQKDEDLGRADETYIRDGLTIIGESRIHEPGVRALVLAEHPPITEFLGDAENPAHTKWLPTTKHFRGKYSPGNALLDYIKLAALRLANVLGRVENELLEDLLDDVFGIPDPKVGKSSEEISTGKKGGRKPPKGGLRRTRYLETSRLDAEAGFAVRLSPEAEKCPDRVIIRVAYETEHGDPFKLYHPADFDLSLSAGAIHTATENCQISRVGSNRLEVEPVDANFCIKVTGFDRNRDLRLDVHPEVDNSEVDE